ncbi:hypothetical protein AQUCO_06700014v1 [Aquilegia coerulea]|uniref:Nudix hydrolase domain-containing protein n=1 Tax=Aquilegia coerulea TaxID=218851 RepID=A0A2G5CBP4_AQUCA|nr:hypothetical protein AQUCO_06700014v1 [Aquilegia coerulea]
MECKLFCTKKSMSVSEIVCLGKTMSNSFDRWTGGGSNGVELARQFCSCRGVSLKASYSTTRKSKSSMEWIGQNKFAVESNSTNWIIGTNGVISSSSLGECYLLDATEDNYEGIIVDPERLPSNPNTFASRLQSSLASWISKGKKGIWLKLPVERSELVPIAVKEGFQYHHAEREYIMMTYWIPQEPSMLPANATHQVGVGGFVINDNNEVLVVQEKHCTPACAGLWKLPTGFILESEEIFTGVVREVKEETGIDTEFVEVVAFRHALRVAFEKSDLLFICMLRPLSTQIKVDDLEIKDAKWMPLTEFLKQPHIRGDRMFKKIIDICIARLGKRYCGLSSHRVTSKFDGKSSTLYYNVVEPEDNCPGS